MTKALLFIIFGLLFIALGVYFLMTMEKLDDVSKQIKKTTKQIESLPELFEKIRIKLASIEKPLSILNTYSSKVVSFMKK